MKEYLINNNEQNSKILELKNIFYYAKNIFGIKKKIILNNINLSINKNEIIALIGKNGVGKTTLFEIISRIIRPTSGQIIYYGNLTNNDIKKLVNMQSQDLSFVMHLKVKEILKFIIRLQNIDISLIQEEYDELLDILNIKELINEYINKLSNGQKQKINLLISLLNHSPILLLDEYYTGLDLLSKKEIIQFILKFIKKYHITLIFISHEIEGFMQYSTRFILLKDTSISIDITREEVLKEYNSVQEFIDKTFSYNTK